MYPIKAHYSDSLFDFTSLEPTTIISRLHQSSHASSWLTAIECLQLQFKSLPHLAGDIALQIALDECQIEAAVLYRGIVFIIQFDLDSSHHLPTHQEKTHQLACKLKQYHQGSEALFIVPVLLTFNAMPQGCDIVVSEHLVANTICDNGDNFAALIEHLANQYKADQILLADWLNS